MSAFGDSKGVCSEDDNATESFQRKLRKAWGKAYKANYTALKKEDKGKRLNTLIYNHRLNNDGKSKRELTVDAESLVKTKTKTKSRRSRNIYEHLTFEGFKEHMEKPKNGGYDASAIQNMWMGLQASQKPCDSKGVVRGVGGHKRYRIKVGSESESASESAEERRHEIGKKQRKYLCPKDASDFLAGLADFDPMMDTEPLPKELINFGKVSAAGSSDAAPPPEQPGAGDDASNTASTPQTPSVHLDATASVPPESASKSKQPGKEGRFKKAEVIANAKTTWHEGFDNLSKQIEETKILITNVWDEDNSVEGDRPYRSHIDMLHVRSFVFRAVANAGLLDQTLGAIRARTSSSSSTEKIPPLSCKGCSQEEQGVLTRVQDFGIYMEKLNDMQPISVLKSKMSGFDLCSSKAEYLVLNKELQSIKSAITTCIKQTKKAVTELQKAIDRHKGQVVEKQDAAARSSAEKAVDAARKAAEPKAKAPTAGSAGDNAGPVMEILKIVELPSIARVRVPAAQTLQEALEAANVDLHGRREPVMVGMPEVVSQITTDPECRKHMGSFHADFVLSMEYRSKHGRAQLTLADMKEASNKFHGIRAPGEYQFTQQEFEALALGAKPTEVLKTWLTSDSCTIWGMAPTKQHVGVEQHFFGTVRLQVQGFRQCVCMPYLKARAAWGVDGEDDDFFSWIENGTTKEMSEFAAKMKPHIWSGTIGPNDVVFLPAGFLYIERSLTSTASGLKRVWLQPGDLEKLQKIEDGRTKKSKTAKLFLSSVPQIIAARTVAHGCH